MLFRSPSTFKVLLGFEIFTCYILWERFKWKRNIFGKLTVQTWQKKTSKRSKYGNAKVGLRPAAIRTRLGWHSLLDVGKVRCIRADLYKLSPGSFSNYSNCTAGLLVLADRCPNETGFRWKATHLQSLNGWRGYSASADARFFCLRPFSGWAGSVIFLGCPSVWVCVRSAAPVCVLIVLEVLMAVVQSINCRILYGRYAACVAYSITLTLSFQA